MKKNNAILAGVAAVALAAAMVPAAMAESTMTGNAANQYTTTGMTDVKYAVTESYEWTIHSEIDFGENAGVNKSVEKTGNTVSVTKNIIPDGTKLQITVAGSGTDGAFEIKNGSTPLTYTVKKGDNGISSGGSVLDVSAGTNAADAALTFTLSTTTKGAEVAGDYKGTVTYTATVVSASK